MKTIRKTSTILALVLITFTAISCKNSKKEQNKNEMNHTKMNHDNSDGHHDGEKKEMAMNDSHKGNSEAILTSYFKLKDALV